MSTWKYTHTHSGKSSLRSLLRMKRINLTIWYQGPFGPQHVDFFHDHPKMVSTVHVFFYDEPHASAKHFFAKIGINFSSSLMSLPLGGKNKPVALAKAVGLLFTLAQTSKLGSHMHLQPTPLAYILQTQFLPKKLG